MFRFEMRSEGGTTFGVVYKLPWRSSWDLGKKMKEDRVDVSFGDGRKYFFSLLRNGKIVSINGAVRK